MDMGQSQSSMGMGGYSNGGTNEGLLYEQTTVSSIIYFFILCLCDYSRSNFDGNVGRVKTL